MKNTVILIFCLFLIFWATTSQALCTTKQTSYLRSEPTIESNRLKTLPKYTPLIEIERKGKWVHVKGHNYKGWIFNTLVSNDIKCMLIKDPDNIYCQKTSPRLGRPISYQEGFKVIEKKFGCNKVEDKWGKQTTLSSADIWPESERKMLEIKIH